MLKVSVPCKINASLKSYVYVMRTEYTAGKEQYSSFRKIRPPVLERLQ
jgi:hypothetical protein